VAHAEEKAAPGATWDLARCVAFALERHPSILGAAGNLKASESRVGQARAGYYPQLSASAGYNRNAPGGTTSGAGGTIYDSYSTGVSVNQTVFDFFKTSTQVKVQRLGADSSRADLEQAVSQVAFDVKKAYYGLLQARRLREANREAVASYQQHLDRAKKFFEVGLRPKFDVTKAEVDLSNARLNLLKAENSLRLARLGLGNAMGLPGEPPFDVEDSLAFQPYPASLDEALQKGYERRPDLRSIQFRREAAESSIDLAKKGYFPVLSGNAGYGYSGQEFPLDRGWNVGATLSVPLFSGFSTAYQTDEARANLEILRANEELVRQSVRLEIQQALLNLQEARDRVALADLEVRQAAENLELARGRYGAGVGSPIEVNDALLADINAKTAHTAALYDYRLAQASLEKATGEK
jgi:TolC family type I secretion outer membrane protein